MMPVNNKSLFARLCEKLEEIESENYDRNKMSDVAMIAKEAGARLDHELKLTLAECRAAEVNKALGTNITVRRIEIKGFDDTTNQR